MNNTFQNALGLSLLADYYNVSFLMENGRGYDCNFLVPKSIGAQFANVIKSLDCNFTGYECDEDSNLFWLEFETEMDKSKADDYFQSFNHTHRVNLMIANTDVYEGKPEPVQYLCGWYLDEIERFLAEDMKGVICIPQGISEGNSFEREFMVYDESGMKGLHKGSSLFQNPKIRFANYFEKVQYWGDVSIVVLEALMAVKNDKNNFEYLIVLDAAKKIIENLKSWEISELELKESVTYFESIRTEFLISEVSKNIDASLINAYLVASCVKNSLEIECKQKINDTFFEEVVNDSSSYLSEFYLQ